MKVIDHDEYRPEFPETFRWSQLDSIHLCNVGNTIANHVSDNLRKDRNDVPGLRRALKIIAEYAEVTKIG